MRVSTSKSQSSVAGERDGVPVPPADLLPAARRVRVPVLYVTTDNDGYSNFGEASRQLYRASKHVAGTKLLIVSGLQHGVDTLPIPKVRAAVIAAILGA